MNKEKTKRKLFTGDNIVMGFVSLMYLFVLCAIIGFIYYFLIAMGMLIPCLILSGVTLLFMFIVCLLGFIVNYLLGYD